MDIDKYQKARELFHQVFHLAPDDRRALYREQALGDEVIAQVESLLSPPPVSRHAFEESRLGVFDQALQEVDASTRETLERLGERAAADDRYLEPVEIGRGGMGRVLRVWDRHLRRSIAMKVLLGNDGQSGKTTPPAAAVDRFLEEAQITAQLDHPGIVPLHEVGLDEHGHPFFTMKRVEGNHLGVIFQEHAAGNPEWSMARCIGLLVRAAEAVAFAHSRGVVHRDLKPSNVMVGGYGEVYVMDWGLARSRDRQASANSSTDIRVETDLRYGDEQAELSPLMTGAGSVLGTPAYMSPEQARGEVDNIGPASDIYSLGAMLYSLLGGKAPYTDTQLTADTGVTGPNVLTSAPTPLRDFAIDAPPEIIAICEKAMQRDAAARYSSMRELAADLRRFNEGRTVRAYRSGPWVELTKWIRRNRAVALASGLAILFAIGGSLATARSQRERAAEALAASQRAEAANVELRKARDAEADANRELRVARDAATEAAELATLESNISEEVSSFLISLFEASSPKAAMGSPLTAEELLEAGLRDLEEDRFADAPAMKGRLLAALGNCLKSLARMHRASPLLDEAHELLTQEYGAGHETTLRAAIDRGVVLAWIEERDAAEAFLQESLLHSIDSLGGSHAVTIRMTVALCDVLVDRGGYDLAIELLLARLSDLGLSPADVGAASIGSISLFTKLGRVYLSGSRFEEADVLLPECVEPMIRLAGPNHPSTLETRRQVVGLRLRQGRYAEAEAELIDLVDRSAKVNGDDHSLTLALIGLRAEIANIESRYDDAFELYRETIEGYRRTLGPDHGETLKEEMNLAIAQLNSGRLTQAIETHESVLARCTDIWQPDSEEYVQVRMTLARMYSRAGRVDDAEPMLIDAIEQFGRILGPAHLQTLEAKYGLVSLYFLNHRSAEAEALAVELARQSRATHGTANPRTALALLLLGEIYTDLDRLAEASEALQECFDITLHLGPGVAGLLDLDEIEGLLTRVYRLRERPDLALSAQLARLRSMEELHGEEHDQTLAAADGVVRAYLALLRDGPGSGELPGEDVQDEVLYWAETCVALTPEEQRGAAERISRLEELEVAIGS